MRKGTELVGYDVFPFADPDLRVFRGSAFMLAIGTRSVSKPLAEMNMKLRVSFSPGLALTIDRPYTSGSDSFYSYFAFCSEKVVSADLPRT